MWSTVLHTATLLLSFVALHLYQMLPKPSILQKIGRWYLWLNLIQVLVYFLSVLFFSKIDVYCIPPFALLYGPIAYFVYIALFSEKLSRRTVYYHVMPFVVVALLYIVLLLDFGLQQAFAKVYYIGLSGLMVVSWCIYPIFILAKGTNGNTFSLRLYRIGLLILAMLTLVMLPFVWTETSRKLPNNPYMFNWITLLAMLIGSFLAYMYFFRQLSTAVWPQVSLDQKQPSKDDDDLEINTVTKELSAAHKQLIQAYLDRQKRFLDPNFRLDDMARELGLGKSIISQFFQQMYGDGFLKTINSWRVEQACLLLQDESLDCTMEELATRCGFNSRASFYRNFSKERQCSPMEFRENVLHND